ncbi:flagellin [Brevibacillus sp. SIMBA_040]|uniref:flagellin N-terminal helical domain-containing protein n=1 Tax=unclassified Brevibacillus TaxID=2684853 RepID=UPI003978CE7A
MIINHNLPAMNTHRNMGNNVLGASKSMEKLSSGLRINRAADDAAGLSISEKMRGQIRGLAQASRNAQDGISLVQTAEGAMDEISNMLVRLKELSVQKANGTYNADDKANLELEADELINEIKNIEKNTKFNGTEVLDKAKTFDIIISDSDQIKLTIKGADVSKASALTKASNTAAIEDAIKDVNTARSTLGAQQNRLESTVRNVNTTVENLQASESRIRDVDMASEMMALTKNNILLQASQSMLAQANQQPQGVLQLLR